MKQKNPFLIVALLAVLPGLAACQDEARQNSPTPSADSGPAGKPGSPATTDARNLAGKPSAPISMEYEVLGNPVVGSPVAINVRISASSEFGPVEVRYSIPDYSALVFQQGQVERVKVNMRDAVDLRQLAVIPQREGRAFVNVSAEVQTPGGIMIKSMAIPVQVGGGLAKPQLNGELRQGPDGETVISMPAEERPPQ
jgi:hypothetical protein